MNDSASLFLDKFNTTIKESEVFVFITRDSDLQRQACSQLAHLLTQIASEKESAIARGDESYANILLGCQCAASAVLAEIKMWLLLKEGRPDDAWDELVNAQRLLSYAMRTDKGFEHLDQHIQRLDAVERIVFPPQVFLSTGMIVKKQTCSICGKDYEDCDHIKGRPYMGKFCTVTIVPSQIDHVAMVDNPANKSCRIVKFSAEGGDRNRMTWRVEPKNNNAKGQTDGLAAQGILATDTTFAE